MSEGDVIIEQARGELDPRRRPTDAASPAPAAGGSRAVDRAVAEALRRDAFRQARIRAT